MSSNLVGRGIRDLDSVPGVSFKHALSCNVADFTSQAGQPSLSSSDGKPFIRISLSNLLENLRYILEDIYKTDPVPLKRYELHMTKLQLYLTDYPQELQNPTVDRLLDMEDKQRTILVTKPP